MAALGIIVAATVLGFAIGIMRLSVESTLMLKGFATIYVESAKRNLPLLLQLFFWYFAVLRALYLARREQIELIPRLSMPGSTSQALYLPAPACRRPVYFQCGSGSS